MTKDQAEIDDIKYMLDKGNVMQAKLLLDAFIEKLIAEPIKSLLLQTEEQRGMHENGHCWCGAWHEAKITPPKPVGPPLRESKDGEFPVPTKRWLGGFK